MRIFVSSDDRSEGMLNVGMAAVSHTLADLQAAEPLGGDCENDVMLLYLETCRNGNDVLCGVASLAPEKKPKVPRKYSTLKYNPSVSVCHLSAVSSRTS